MYITLTYNDLELEYPMMIINRLIYDGIIGIDVLTVLNAKIYVINNDLLCEYKGRQHKIRLNQQGEYSVKPPKIIRKLEGKYEVNWHCGNTGAGKTTATQFNKRVYRDILWTAYANQYVWT